MSPPATSSLCWTRGARSTSRTLTETFVLHFGSIPFGTAKDPFGNVSALLTGQDLAVVVAVAGDAAGLLQLTERRLDHIVGHVAELPSIACCLRPLRVAVRPPRSSRGLFAALGQFYRLGIEGPNRELSIGAIQSLGGVHGGVWTARRHASSLGSGLIWEAEASSRILGRREGLALSSRRARMPVA